MSENVEVERAKERDSQTQQFGRFRLVMTRTLPAALAMGMAQHTTLGVERPFVDMRERGGGEMKRGGRDREKDKKTKDVKREFKMSA